MSLNPGITTIPGFAQDAVRNICSIIAPLFSALLDEVGAPVTVRVASAFADEAAAYPQIAVRVRLGPQPINPGDNIMRADTTPGGSAYFGEEATDSTVTFDIAALSDPQRQYLLSYLRWAMQTAWNVDPATGAVTTDIILKLFDDAGVIPKRFLADQTPDPRLSDARPYGQIYRATVALQADIACSWTVPLTPYPSIAFQVVATPDLAPGTSLYLPGQPAPFPLAPQVATVTEAVITHP